MQKRIEKLIDVKSILTLVLCAVFAYLSIIGKIDAKEFQTVFLMIITFYFTRRTDNNEKQTPIDKE